MSVDGRENLPNLEIERDRQPKAVCRMIDQHVSYSNNGKTATVVSTNSREENTCRGHIENRLIFSFHDVFEKNKICFVFVSYYVIIVIFF